MNISEPDSSISIISLEGEISEETAEELARLQSRITGTKTPPVVLDFSGMKHINSAGLSLLVKFCLAARKSGRAVFAAGLNDRYREIFKLTGLSEGMPVIEDAAREFPGLDQAAAASLESIQKGGAGQSDYGWAGYLTALDSSMMTKEALNRNVHGRKVLGPFQGFGPLWEKTYLLTIRQTGTGPAELIEIMKGHLPEFQPSSNRFYPSPEGIKAGEIVLIDSMTPGGVVSTGVLVLYADETSFTLMTPRGHPEAGWVTFSSMKADATTFFQIQGLASSEDPVYELAFRLAGAKFQETIWKHVLASLASHINMPQDIIVEKKVINPSLNWGKLSNLWYNAQIRSLPLNLKRLAGRN